jgi:ribosome-associated toxin RatA of RatAB toxin-antitoxin module
MNSTSAASVKIDASATEILNVLLDFENYDKWSGLTEVAVINSSGDGLEYLVAFQISSNGMQDKVKVKVRSISSTEISWELMDAALLTELSGHFTLVEETTGCLVNYSLNLKFKNPLFNAMKRTAEAQMISKILNRLNARMAEL